MTSARRNDLALLGAALLVLALDQLTKRWITQYFHDDPFSPAAPILGSVLELRYLRNTGVAFSLFQGQLVLFLFILVAIGLIGWLYWRVRENGSLLLKVTFGMILGGAIGNLLDRFRLGYVVDFIHFQIPGHFDWPVFNIADSAISIGVVLLAYQLWRSSARAPQAQTEAERQAESVEAPGAQQAPESAGPSVRRNSASR